MTLSELKALKADGRFHHATYRNQGTLWEGLWIYSKDEKGFNGYKPEGAFFKDSPSLEGAFKEVRSTGISLGAYGQG
jgi:hypothetical protein